ncbi:MAG TPA: hypothetical protein VM241_07050 [Candidatus Thermoplasmatota archaeon]|nr:hypothetical protein [Candidatus Thermoplasmatota archaeon]
MAILPRWALLPALILLAFALAGCAQGGVSNMTDNFSYGGQVAGKSGTNSYTWKVTGSTVRVSWGGQSASGTLDLVLKDGLGQQVYIRTFGGASQSGASETLQNVKAGDWTVTLSFHGFTGQMGLNLQASPGSPGGAYCPPTVPYC